MPKSVPVSQGEVVVRPALKTHFVCGCKLKSLAHQGRARASLQMRLRNVSTERMFAADARERHLCFESKMHPCAERVLLSPPTRGCTRDFSRLHFTNTHSFESILTAIKVFQREFASKQTLPAFFPQFSPFSFFESNFLTNRNTRAGGWSVFLQRNTKKKCDEIFFSVRARQR